MKMKLKTIIVGIGFLLISTNAVKAQVVITAPGVLGSLIKPEMLWNIIVVNQDIEPFSGRITIVVSDAANQPLFKAQSGILAFAKGVKQINYNSALPIEYSYNSLGQNNEWIPAGKYTVCYSLNKEVNKSVTTVVDDCLDMTIDAVNPPLLNNPLDNSNLYESYPSFSWTPPAPKQLFKRLFYEFRLVEVLDQQAPIYAIQNNVPIVFKNGINTNAFVFPSSYKGLEVGHEYAWQVTAYSDNYFIKSEVWKFKVIRDSVMAIVESSPYIQLRQDKPDIGIMHQGYIKIAFKNYTKDTIGIFTIKPEDDGSKENPITVEIKIKAGENYILKKLDSKYKFDENKVYRVTWINTWKEAWAVRFKPKYYR
jgi:hypothetical protein